MEPAQEQQTGQINIAAATKSCLTDDDAFDSVRQAAVVLFKQRTKDLTQLANVEAQSQKIEAELQQAQTSLTQLSAQLASLEALVEDEQQRIRQREGRLTELHSALVQLDEEQRTYVKLQQSAEAAIGAAATFIAHFTSAEGRLLQLLVLAKERIGGRSARELQIAVTQVQQRLADAAEQQQRLLNGPFCLHSSALTSAFTTATNLLPASTSTENQQDVVSAFVTVMQDWMTQTESWSRHRELTEVLSALRRLFQWVTEDQDTDEREAPTASQMDASKTASLWFPLPLCPAACLHEDAFLKLREVELDKLILEQIFSPLNALRVCVDQLTAACASIHLCLPIEVSTLFTSLETTIAAEWMSLVAQRRQWEELMEDTAKASELAAAAAQAQHVACTELQMLTESCAHLNDTFDQRKLEVESGKAMELLNYAAAWQKGWHTISAQRRSLLSMQSTADTRIKEAARADALLTSEAEAHAAKMDVCQRSVQEQQAKLSAAQKQLEEASVQKAALEEELTSVQQIEREVQQQLEALLSNERKPTSEAEVKAPVLSEDCRESGAVLKAMECTRPSAASALKSVAASFDVYNAWTTTLQAQRNRLADTDAFAPLLDALCRAAEGRDHAMNGADTQSAGLICTALQHIATTLELPTELFQPDLLSDDVISRLSCLTALAAVEQSMRTSAEGHRAFSADAQAEMSLLRQELSTPAYRKTGKSFKSLPSS